MAEQKGAQPNKHQALIDELKAKHGENVAFWDYEDFGLVAVAKPAKAEDSFKEFFDALNDRRLKSSGAFQNFGIGCVVHPDHATALQIAEEYPDDVYGWMTTVRGMCGDDLVRGSKESDLPEELRSRAKRLAWWTVPGVGLLVAGKPKDSGAYYEFVDAVQSAEDGESLYDAYKTFALACLETPEQTTFERALKDYPALAVRIANACRAFCQSGSKRLGKA